MDRPRISLVLAMSLDGKIADAQRRAARFSSQADLDHLEARVAAADGVLFGSGTLRAYGTTLSVRNPALIEARRQRGQTDQPIHIVWSPSGHLDPQWRFFQQPVPRGLITTPAGAQPWQTGEFFDRLWVIPKVPTDAWNWPKLLAQFPTQGLHTLALLGGGHLTADLLRHGCIDEVYITVCPLLLGGATAPTPVDGEGFLAELAPRLTLLEHRTIGDEVFLHYLVHPSGV
ncbi:RibD family protein [Phormidium sp. FACHB-1136]|uniref:RibD family protein n=1 Tax=Phormidium sp. FACHB-1136 TaxID=2692848 RepID=UPI001687F93A|nr:RibD family protein [Phormidium sp. FACHB-1136]MBD2427840.1 RibD family protein [Phormidium sp. FACHB-1136]